jgi:peptide deformylase
MRTECDRLDWLAGDVRLGSVLTRGVPLAIRPIVKFPDARLRLVAAPVSAFDAALQALAADLLDTLRAVPGIGITAPHVGVATRLVVLDLPGAAGAQVYVNPAIAWVSADRVRHEEGSISMPGVSDTVERAARVRVSYRDLGGAERIEEADGLLAVCHQHEIDQLDGIFWIQRLSPLRRERLVRRYEKRRGA